MTIRTLGGALGALALLSEAACSKEITGFVPGTEPWEVPADAPAEWLAWPDTVGTLQTMTGTRLANGDTPAYYWAHGRVLLAAPIADVWTALQWQPGVVVAVYPDDQVDCEPTHRPEPEYELSYAVKEIPKGDVLHRENWFVVNWRGATSRDAQAIQRIEVKAQKVDGTTYIQVMRQSVVVTPAPGGGTHLEIVRHISAPGESEITARDWIALWVDAVDAQARGTPLAPLTRCAFP